MKRNTALLAFLLLACYSYAQSSAYLFAYFTGNDADGEAIRFAVSTDGYNYRALNGNRPVIDSRTISSTGGVRDPHILRCEDGKTFYMVVTDMVSAQGWNSNRAMVLMKSTDLLNWTSTVINIQKKYAGQEDLLRVWAPQTIYDKAAGKYMVYWSMKHGDGPDIIYYAYANDDFTDLIGEPKPLFLPADGKACIDGDIVYKDGVYHLFYKTEGHGNGIKVATTRALTSGEWEEDPEYKQQTRDDVEGAGTFKLIGQDKYILMYDVYKKGKYQFTETTDLKNFKVIDHEVTMDFHPRHGTVMPITALELERLQQKWGTPSIEIDASCHRAPIQSTMYGIFFEDINFGADGGLYAELIKNRSFEFPQPFVGWTPFGQVEIKSDRPCFDRNPHYVSITNDGRLLRAGLDNEGFRGIGLKQGAVYCFSAYMRNCGGNPLKLSIELVNAEGENLLKKEIKVRGSGWQKISAKLVSPFTDTHSRLRIVLLSRGTVDMDHISLFPADTWKGRENGMRKDLVQALYDLNPGVFRFPGGCIVEGNSLATRYQWKKTVGPVENRPLNENRWNYTFKHKAFPDYFQSCGLGFFEYFQLGEDLGAEPLPILSCGLSCQYESNEVVPLDSLQPYIEDVLDLIEFANGPVSSVWGKVRADMGHPEPFHLKFIGIGNEQWGTVYPERLEMFVKAIRTHYPEIKIVGSSGPSADGDKFDYLWPEMKRIGVDLVDEHYYMDPEWFFNNAHRYDNYDRKGPKVFAGEYASHDHSTKKDNNFLTALSEAAFMTGLERNADVVHMATYAPLFAHVDAWQWNPDLIWFDNLQMVRTPNYYVQQLYGMNAGTHVLPITLKGGTDGVLYASAVWDEKSKEVIVKVVNRSDAPQQIPLTINGLKKRMLSEGTHIYLQSDDLKAKNVVGEPERIVPHLRPMSIKGNQLQLEIAPQSFNVYRFK